jgi:hypothetical protein
MDTAAPHTSSVGNQKFLDEITSLNKIILIMRRDHKAEVTRQNVVIENGS